MKKILSSLLITAAFFAFAGEFVSGRMSTEFTIYLNADFTRQDVIDLSLGKKITKGDCRRVKPDAETGLVDFIANGGKFKSGGSQKTALLLGEFIADTDGDAVFGGGADWFWECFINGRNFVNTFKAGNGKKPVSMSNFPFVATVKKGKNLIALRVKSGSAGWSAALGALKDTVPAKLCLNRRTYLTHASAGTVTVNFFTVMPAGAFVEYRPAGTSEWQRNYETVGGQVRNDSDKHTVKLNDLRHNTLYEYRTGYIQKDCQERYNEIRTFRSFTDQPLEFKIFYTSDTQYPPSQRIQWLKNYIEKAGAAKADIFFHGGDIDSLFFEADPIYLDSFINVLTAKRTQDQIIAVSRGNHEYRGEESGRFFRYFGGPENKSYFMFRQGNVCFIVLDSGEDKPRIARNPLYFRTFDQELMHEQRKWLETAVKHPDFQTAKFRVVLIHSPMHEPYMAKSSKILTDGLLTGDKAKYKIDLWVCGHTHRYARSITPGKPELHCMDERASAVKKSPFITNGVLLVNDGPGGNDGNGSGILLHFRENEIEIKAMSQTGKVFEHFLIGAGGVLKDLRNL